MSSLVLLLVIIAGLSVTRLYSGKDHRLPPASTPRGKQARILLVIILIPLVATLIYRMISGGSSRANIVAWIEALVLGGGLAIYRYVQFRNKQG